MFSYVERFFNALHSFLHKPLHVLVLCLALVFTSFIIKGSLFQLMGLYSDYDRLNLEVKELKKSTKEVQMKIKRVSDPSYLELEVRKRFDLVSKGDLVFIFSDED